MSAPGEPSASHVAATGAAKRILVVCTANVCRSPVAERLLARHLTGAGHDAVVTSAGVIGGRLDVHPFTADAARLGGIDLSQHRSRLLTGDLLTTDGSDLVIGMAREHVAAAVALDASVWPRTFTLRELVRRASAVPSPAAGTAWNDWLAVLASGRDPSAMLVPDPVDDVRDAYTLPAAAHMAMTGDLNALCEQLASLVPPPA